MAVSLKTKRRNDNVGYHLIQNDFGLLSILSDLIQHKSDDLLIVKNVCFKKQNQHCLPIQAW